MKNKLRLINSFTTSLTTKFIIIFSIVVSIFIITIIYISYSRTTDILKNDIVMNNKNILKFTNKNVQEYLSQIDELSLLFRKNDRFMNILLTEAEDYSSGTFVQDSIKNLFYSRDDIEGVQFYIPSTKTLYSISRKNPNMLIAKDDSITRLDWYKRACMKRYFRDIEPGNSMENIGYDITKGNVFFTFHRALVNFGKGKELGVISISLNYKGINKISADASESEDEIFGLFDGNDTAVFYNRSQFISVNRSLHFIDKIRNNDTNGDFIIKGKDQDFLVIYSVLDNYKWKVVKLIPIDSINKKAQQTRNLSFLIGMSFIVLLIIIIILISNAITGPLRKLAKQMDKVGTGNFEVQVDVNSSDEIGRLSKKFNSMVVQIDDLINEEYKIKLSEKNARLKALEAQINPHFLYNSLQAISSRALVSGRKDISKMIEALAFTLRYCIKGGDMVKLSKEIEHVKNYLILHEVRFEDRLAVNISLEETALEVLIPKLSIQTIVENSIKHALEVMNSEILIIIKTYYEQDKFIIEVVDNGPGITEERLSEIVEAINDQNFTEDTNESIGLKNLNIRLKLLFGSEAELTISSELNIGTKVSMKIPIVGK